MYPPVQGLTPVFFLRKHPTVAYIQGMSSVAEIEKAIANLSAQEFVELERWFDTERNRKWDRQIEADSTSGALDFLLKEVEEDVAKGRTRPTDELRDDS